MGMGRTYTTEEMPYEYHHHPARNVGTGVEVLERNTLPIGIQNREILHLLQRRQSGDLKKLPVGRHVAHEICGVGDLGVDVHIF